MADKKWPRWWDWELELSPHLFKRMTDRRFTEVDLRSMLDSARAHRRAPMAGRWIIEARHRSRSWEVVVEPDEEEELLVVITRIPRFVRAMQDSYLEITFRHGRVLAAYYYLPRRAGDVSVRTEEAEAGMLVDYARGGRPIGIEITAPTRASLAALNRILKSLGLEPARREDFAPLRAA